MTDDGRSESEQSGSNGPSEDESTKDGPSGPVKLIGFVVAVLGIVLVAVTPNPPISFQHWVQVIGGASITGFLTTFAGWYELVRPGGRLFHGAATTALGWIVEHWRLLVVGVVLSTALALGVPPAWDFARGVAIDIRGCSPATQLRVVASPATVATARGLAGAYERWTADENHGCPTADIYVYAARSSDIREELGRQWPDDGAALRELGPRPDVWLAGTSHETAGLGSAIASSTTVAFSPVVLAVPQGVTNLQPRQSAGWSELFGRLTDQGVPVVRADPDTSEVGLLATTLLYERPDQPGTTGREPLMPAAIEQRIDQALDGGGFPITDTAGLLCRHREVASRAAVVATEQDVARFNRGEPLGAACPGQSGPPRPPLVALYPGDTRGLDHQFVRLSWSAPAQAQAAEAFERWLQSDLGRAAVMRTGLRPPGTFPVGPVLNTVGVDASVRPEEAPVPMDEWIAAAATYADTQRPGRVLFAVDTSGSMAAVSPPDGTRSAVVARAVKAALRGMGAQDEFGLWFFSGTGHAGAVPLGARRDAYPEAEHALDTVRPSGDTPLYRTMVDAAAVLRSGAQDRLDAVVVLTDGNDTSSGGVGPDAVAAAFADSGVRLIVVTIGEVRCSDGALGSLAVQSSGLCFDADLPTLDSTLASATAELWGGR